MKGAKTEAHPKESSFTSILSGWARQGVQSFFATQRILMDLAMKQNANVMHAVRKQLSDPQHSPTAILSDMAGESINNFIEGQKVLLDLGKQQNEILMNGVKERVGEWPAAEATTYLLSRSVDTFIHTQQELLKVASKQAHTWMEAAKAGKPYDSVHLVDLAREGMESYVNAQKQFLDLIAEETTKAISGKHANGGMKKVKKTEIAQLARQATESFVETQKKLADVAGKQVNANVKSVAKTLDLLRPFPFVPLTELTREGVKSYVEAQKALVDAVVKPTSEHKHPAKTRHARKPAEHAKKHAAAAA